MRAVSAFPFPQPPACGPNRKRFLVLSTPAVANTDGPPHLPAGCGAAVDSPVAISGAAFAFLPDRLT